MHAYLLHIYDHDFTLFIVYCYLSSRMGHDFAHVRVFVQIEIDLSSCLRHPFGYILFYTLKLPNGF
jgi:hypothetical protein